MREVVPDHVANVRIDLILVNGLASSDKIDERRQGERNQPLL